jgi:hypothetical protein
LTSPFRRANVTVLGARRRNQEIRSDSAAHGVSRSVVASSNGKEQFVMISARLSTPGRLALSSLLLLPLAGVVAAPSAYAAQPIGGCPDNYQLVTVKYVVKNAGLTAPDPSMDQNGDGYTCLLLVADESGRFTRATWHDNNL